jgi:hypothetical protein
MANVSQRDSTAMPPGSEVPARHTNHLRSSACDFSSFLDRRIRHHQVLGQPAFAAFAPGNTHMDTLREFLSKYSDVSFVLVVMIVALVFYLLDILVLAGVCVLSIILLAFFRLIILISRLFR